MQTSDNDVQKQISDNNPQEQYRRHILARFESVGLFNEYVKSNMQISSHNLEYINQLSETQDDLQVDDYNVFSLMQMKLNGSSRKARKAFDKNKVPKPSDKAGKILQLIIKKQHSKAGFKLLLQEIVNEFMPGNEINIENIFQENHIDQDQMTDMYFESDNARGKNLVIQTKDKEFTFDKDGTLKATCDIHRSIFGTMRRTNLKHVTTQVLSNAVPQLPTQVTTPMSSQGSTAIQQVPSNAVPPQSLTQETSMPSKISSAKLRSRSSAQDLDPKDIGNLNRNPR
jgi:hypothetical protein